jgi:Fe-S-cluster containining protein
LLKKLKKFIYTKILRRKYYRSGNCLGCGRCCKKIYVKTHNHVIQEEKEFEKLKYLHIFYNYLTVVDKDETGLVFSCSNLDEKTNLCKVHKNRPGICRRYPQEEIFAMGGALTEECGYKMLPIIPFSEVFDKMVNGERGTGNGEL